MRKRVIILLLNILVLAIATASAQIVNPVKWTAKVKMTSDTEGVISFSATIDNGWHMYGLNIPEGGPTALSVDWKTLSGVKLNGALKPDHAAHEQHDPTFDMTLQWWSHAVTLTQKFEVTAPSYQIKGDISYMACNDVTCMAPTKEPFDFSGKAKLQTPSTSDSTPVAIAVEAVDTNAAAPQIATDSIGKDKLWAPVDTHNAISATDDSASSLFYIFIACFIGGLLALVTPCVWPMIPLTVSFFLKKSGSRKKSITNAIAYGVSIIVIYLALGLIITAIFGPNALNALATNAICNIIFFLLLVVFAISFFGAFDLSLPDSWATKMDRSAERTTGLISIFFMAFTLALVSFSCTGPIIGTLLVEAATSGSKIGPAVGMFGFALALSIPFAFFALFPSLLKKLPRSGGWLNTVKVVLGFIELALSLKFLSVADLAYGWHILDREVFLALWIAIFGLLGLYLLGVFRFKSDAKTEGIGVVRFFTALVSLSFTAYLIPGLWGAPLKATSSFVPPLYTQDFNLYGTESSEYDNYDEGMRAAHLSGKPVFLDFSGYGCVNCRKMEGAVLSDNEVKKTIKDNFITIQLMVDDKKALPRPIFVEENNRQIELSSYADLWSYLQRHKFGASTQPYYVILNDEGELLSGPYSYDENISRFMDFLNSGIKAFNNAK